MKGMFAAYVALSRVCTAECLLLLRAFTRRLFQQGPPPGPHCLMKLLRARSSLPGQEQYTEADAQAEYAKLKEGRDCARAQHKQEGHSWQCFDCEQWYSAEGFGANAALVNEIFSKCLHQGVGWRALRVLWRIPSLWSTSSSC